MSGPSSPPSSAAVKTRNDRAVSATAAGVGFRRRIFVLSPAKENDPPWIEHSVQPK